VKRITIVNVGLRGATLAKQQGPLWVFASFRARDVDFRFTLNTGRFSASQRMVKTGT
jgi:hypothetical protein